MGTPDTARGEVKERIYHLHVLLVVGEMPKRAVIKEGLWCSWCFEKGGRVVVKERTLSRDILQCAKCKKECLICLSCSDATVRRYQDGADKRCFVCSHMVPAWEQDGKDWLEELSKEGHCSWCFSLAPQRLVKHNTISRSDYVVGHPHLDVTARDTHDARQH